MPDRFPLTKILDLLQEQQSQTPGVDGEGGSHTTQEVVRSQCLRGEDYI